MNRWNVLITGSRVDLPVVMFFLFFILFTFLKKYDPVQE